MFESENIPTDLRDAYLVEAKIGKCDLSDVELQGAKLQRADLEGSNLSNANLSFATLEQTRLQGADLSNANLQDADLHRANLTSTNLKWSNLFGVDFSHATLDDSKVHFAILVDADFSDAQIIDADFEGGYFAETNLRQADISGTCLSDANLETANLSDADLSNADLSDANLSNADLSHVTATSADLSGADLTGVTLQGSNLATANLDGVEVSASKLGTLVGAALQSGDRESRSRAADAAAVLAQEDPEQCTRFIDSLFSVLRESRTSSVQISALRAIATTALQSETSLEHRDEEFARLIRNGSELVREEAICALSPVIIERPKEYTETIRAFEEALNDQYCKQRHMIAQSLAVISHDEPAAIDDQDELLASIMTLFEAANVPETEVRDAAMILQENDRMGGEA